MKLRDIFLAVIVAIVWGMNFTITKIALAHFPPLMLMGLRFLSVTLLLLPYLRTLPMKWKPLLIMSITYGVCYHALAFSGLWYGVDAGVGIIAVQMQVPFTALLGMLLLQDRLGWKRLAGMMIAFTGIIIITDSPNVLANGFGFILIVIAAFFWSVYNIQLKKWGTPDIMPFLAWLSAISAPILFLSSGLLESNQISLLLTIPMDAALAILYTALFTTIIGLGAWSYLMHHYSVHQIAPFSMLAPVFGIFSAIPLLGEKLNSHIIIGGIITILGVAIIILRKPTIPAP